MILYKKETLKIEFVPRPGFPADELGFQLGYHLRFLGVVHRLRERVQYLFHHFLSATKGDAFRLHPLGVPSDPREVICGSQPRWRSGRS